ncbi:MAG: glycosyltransferase family 2 protein [Candidatus Saccharibacteria bacterium]
MQNLDYKISIVIPTYNEQDHIGACLEAISKQIVKPFEVIVVDNMCTDYTVDIAKRFSFVRVVKQTKRGLVHARDKGFDSARGDIIGRIDADTLLPADWTQKIIEIFEDRSVKAVSGGIHFYDIGCSDVIDGIDAYWRAWMARRMTPSSRVFLLGANMAIRRSSWQKVRGQLCHQNGFHEDLDLSLHLSMIDEKVIFDPTLMANVSARRIDSGFFDLTKYAFENPWIYIKHDAREHRYMYPLIGIVLFNYILLRIVFRAFDEQSQRFSFKLLLLKQSMARANPADLA